VRCVVCRPDHFAVVDEINPWMDRAVQPSRERCRTEWIGLLHTLWALGAAVEVMPACPGLADMVFVRDGAVVLNGRAIKGRFLHGMRQREADLVAEWLAAAGCPTAEFELPGSAVLEGGDVAVFGDQLFLGWGFRTNLAARAALASGLGVAVHPLRLVDPRFYHLDTALAPLDDHRIAYYPGAFSASSRLVLERLFPDAVTATQQDALSFGLNLVSDGSNVLLPAEASGFAARLAAAGYQPVPIELSELKKGGGSVKCCIAELRS